MLNISLIAAFYCLFQKSQMSLYRINGRISYKHFHGWNISLSFNLEFMRKMPYKRPTKCLHGQVILSLYGFVLHDKLHSCKRLPSTLATIIIRTNITPYFILFSYHIFDPIWFVPNIIWDQILHIWKSNRFSCLLLVVCITN